MSHTLILNFHPGFPPSRTNATLATAASYLPHTKVVDMHDQAANGQFDTAREIDRLLAARRLVLQFPILWYAPPALLATWQAQVMTQLFYVESERGAHLAGMPMMVAATAGNVPEAYSREGVNGFTLTELLRPLQATARRGGFAWASPHLVFRANKLSDDELAAETDRYLVRLREFAEAIPACPSAPR